MPLRIDRVDAESLAGGSAAPADNGVTKVLELVSCGLPFHGHDLAVLSEDGTTLPERRVGEIVVKGPSVAAGYYENRQATTANWKDGWLHTGDLGYLADGELFVCGRLKDVIVIRGRKFHPNDIESSVRDLPGIRHGNVVAFGVAAGGNEKLVIVAEADCSDAGTLRGCIAARVYESFGLEACIILLVPSGTLPKTTSGKLQRVKAKRLFEEGHLSDMFNSSERQQRVGGFQKSSANTDPAAPAQSI
jgi:fatty-acyl-CoA synthase